MGVSGFLISWANRLATSPQAWALSAETTSEMSSNTNNQAWLGKTAPRAMRLVTASAPDWPDPTDPANPLAAMGLPSKGAEVRAPLCTEALSSKDCCQ